MPTAHWKLLAYIRFRGPGFMDLHGVHSVGFIFRVVGDQSQHPLVADMIKHPFVYNTFVPCHQNVRPAVLEITQTLYFLSYYYRAGGQRKHAVAHDLKRTEISLSEEGKRNMRQFTYIFIVRKPLLITCRRPNRHKRYLSRCFIPGNLDSVTFPQQVIHLCACQISQAKQKLIAWRCATLLVGTQ